MPRRRQEPEPYQRYRAPLQARWRPVILERDGYRCKACGWRPDGARSPVAGTAEAARGQLEVAHITDAVAFVRAAGHHRAVTFSYRWDNLMTLCSPCHRASHAHHLSEDILERRVRVERVQESLRRIRGWSSPFAALPPDLVPPEVRPRRSFHDTIRLSPLVPFPTFARYAADGGLIFEEPRLEDGPQRHPTLESWPS